MSCRNPSQKSVFAVTLSLAPTGLTTESRRHGGRSARCKTPNASPPPRSGGSAHDEHGERKGGIARGALAFRVPVASASSAGSAGRCATRCPALCLGVSVVWNPVRVRFLETSTRRVYTGPRIAHHA